MRFSPLTEKYAQIDLEGRKALRQEDGVKKFDGFSENLKERFGSTIIFEDQSRGIIRDSLIDEIKSISQATGIDFIFADYDFPLHATLLEGLCEDETVRDELFKKIKENDQLMKIINSLNGLEIEFKYLLLDKANVLLTCSHIPREIINARKEISAVFEKSGLKPLRLENILHITIARMTELPKVEQEKKFHEYKNKIIQLRHEISLQPLKLKILKVSSGSTFDFLTFK